MRISLLLRREAFAEVLEKNFGRFLDERYGTGHDVCWSERPFPVPGDKQFWYGNHYLNAFFVPQSGREVLQPAVNEYSRSPVLWRRIPQRIYVALATHKRWRRHLAQSVLAVTPPVPGAEQMVLIPGNNRLRLLDFASRRCFVISKEGAPGSFMQNEIMVRRKHSELPVPELLEVSPGQDWFCEQLVRGRPLNRIAEGPRARNIRERLFSGLALLQRNTLQDTDGEDYTEKLFRSSTELLSRVTLPGNVERSRIESGLKHLRQKILKTLPASGNVRTCLSHGDFQPSNILCDGDRFWVLDWEYAGRRCHAFDLLCWVLRARQPAGLSNRVAGMLKSPQGAFPFEWPSANNNPDSGGRLALRLQFFLLEELLVRMQEISSPYILRPGPHFSEFIMEWDQSVDTLRKHAAG